MTISANRHLFWISAFAVVFAAWLIAGVAFGWTNPGSAPPGGGGAIGAGANAPINSLFVSSAGDVGIGIINPVQKLDVAGYIRGSTGLCIAGDCRTSWPVSGGSGTLTSISAGSGITLSPNPITTTGSISVDTGAIQSRVNGTCPAGQAIRVIDSAGNVACQVVPSSAICTYNGRTYSTGAVCKISISYVDCSAPGLTIAYQTIECLSNGSWSGPTWQYAYPQNFCSDFTPPPNC